MTWSPSPFLKQIAALSILFVIVFSVSSLSEKLIVQPIRSRGAEIATLSERLNHASLNRENEKFLAKRRMAVEQELQSLNIFWAGPNRPQIAAAIEDVLRTAIRQSEGQLISTSVLEDAGKDNMITVRARIDGTLTTLQSMLSAIERSRPRLFVNSLAVTTASAESTAVKAQLLSFEISVAGYVAANDSATP